jgi:hypothetical protein
MSDTPNQPASHGISENPNSVPVGLPPLPTNPSVEAVESFKKLAASLDENALQSMIDIHANISEPSNMITIFSNLLDKEMSTRVKRPDIPIDPV